MELRIAADPIKKWWWLIVLATVLGAISGYLAVRQQPAIYQSRATLMVGNAIEDPNPSQGELVLGLHLAVTYADLAQRDAVRNETMKALGLEWLPPYDVSAPRNTQILEIVVTDTSPERARAVTSELANQIIEQSPSSLGPEAQARLDFVERQLDLLEDSIDLVVGEIDVKQKERSVSVGSRQSSELDRELSELSARLNALQSNYATLLANTSSGATNALSVIVPASTPTSPIGPNRLSTVVAAAAVGFALSLGAAYVIEYLDDTISDRADVRATVGVDVLAEFPSFALSAGESKLVAREDPLSPIAESYRRLRTNIQFANLDSPPRSIVITSASSGEGKSVTAANLAIVLASAGRRVLLIDADLRRPVQDLMFEVPPEPGLSGFLLALGTLDDQDDNNSFRAMLSRFSIASGTENLTLLPRGRSPHNPSELLGTVRMRTALGRAAALFDYVIIDSPPLQAVTDAAILATAVDGVLLVAESGQTRKADLSAAVGQLEAVGATVIGAVITRVPKRQNRYSEYYGQGEQRQSSLISELSDQDVGVAGPDSIPSNMDAV